MFSCICLHSSLDWTNMVAMLTYNTPTNEAPSHIGVYICVTLFLRLATSPAAPLMHIFTEYLPFNQDQALFQKPNVLVENTSLDAFC